MKEIIINSIKQSFKLTQYIKPDPMCTGSKGEPLSGEPFEKPDDCQHFYQCGAGYILKILLLKISFF